jgi:hypothetical protein
MGVRLLGIVLLVGLFCLSIIPLSVSAEQQWWNSEWSYRQEIVIPFNTRTNFSAYQPIDTTIVFSNPCWTENESQTSVRVIYQWKDHELELESQIYDLLHSDAEHITSCNLVFLIPPGADGTGQYYIYYRDMKTSSPEYPDHVSIKEASYFYEPIPGYPVRSDFYEVIQNDSIVYAIAQDGTYLWYTTAQYVTKLSPGATEVNLRNGQTAASFEFAYYYGDEMWQYNSTSQQLVSKEILCDGNLMVSCRIISQSTAQDVQTTAVYKYFYCPTPATRIRAHVIHEALKECFVYLGTNTDGTYAAMQCGVMKSQSIGELNFGRLYPFIHVSSERNVIEEYRVDLNPEYNQEDPVIRLLQNTDDVDLGTKAWTSYDEGSTGEAHALIFGSSSVVKAGADERDGIQVKAYESDYPHLPGLTYTIAGFQFTRNVYEKNVSGKDTVIPKGFKAEFESEFFSSPLGGYPLVEQETDIFQALATIMPKPQESSSPRENITSNRFELIVNLHAAPSFPFGSALSALFGRPFPYLSVEVYQNDTLVCSGTATRLPLRAVTSRDGVSVLERLTTVVHMFDVRNGSLWKKISFQGIQAGRYVVKVFRENPRVGGTRQFIGYAVVDLRQNSTIHIWCRPQASCLISIVDQNGAQVPLAQVQLLCGGMIVSQNITNGEGAVMLAAPCSLLDRYTLRVLYQGFEVENQSFNLRIGRTVFPLRKSIGLDQYAWTLHLVDLWGLPPGVDVRPFLLSNEMVNPTELFGEQTSNSTFLFTHLLPAAYMLQFSYKSFVVTQEVTIPTELESVVFPAVYPVSFRVLDSHGGSLNGVTIRLSRSGKSLEVLSTASESVSSVPPGVYQVSVLSHENAVIGQRLLDVVSERSVDLITTQAPVVPWFVLLGCTLLALCGLAVSVVKKNVMYALIVLVVSLGVSSLVFPWWSLQGSSVGIQTSSLLYLVPLNFVSMTMMSQVIAGELTFFPTVFVTLMTIVVGLMVGGWGGLGGVLAIQKSVRRRWLMVLFGGVFCLLVISVVVFSFAMSAFTEIGVGSFLGQGTVDVLVQGQTGVVPVPCQWGPGMGFWLYVLSLSILGCTFVFILFKKRKEKT